jgi:hypothetical protein
LDLPKVSSMLLAVDGDVLVLRATASDTEHHYAVESGGTHLRSLLSQHLSWAAMPEVRLDDGTMSALVDGLAQLCLIATIICLAFAALFLIYGIRENLDQARAAFRIQRACTRLARSEHSRAFQSIPEQSRPNRRIPK